MSSVLAVARRSKSLGKGIASRLRVALALRGVTTRELARAAQCALSTVNRVLAGDGGNAGVGLLVDIARALEVPPGWLILGEGKGPL